jgi:hypothetical protein
MRDAKGRKIASSFLDTIIALIGYNGGNAMEETMKRTKGIVLVGQLNGHRKIRWGTAFILGCGLGVLGASVATAFYFVLAGKFSSPAAGLGFLIPFSIVGHGIGNACKLPIDQLSPL